MNDILGKFQQLLRELFQFESADLDFGIYRIMNHKRDVIERFITEELSEAIASELEQGALAEQAKAREALAEAREKALAALGADALDADGNLTEGLEKYPAGREYNAAQERAKSTQGQSALEALIYNHLYSFFSRYYQDGDFISKRRYSKKERYAIPYNGEEVALYWANHDQYYIKTAEHFTDYAYKAPNGVTVHFKLQAADVEQDNVKGDKRFFLPRLDEISIDEEAREIVIPFEYRPLSAQEAIAYGKSNQQDKIIAGTLEKISAHTETQRHKEILAASCLPERPNSAGGAPVSYLEHHLRQYARRNTSDFFIHKDLKGFLSRELDFYLKNEVLNLEELEAAGEDMSEGWFQMLRLIKRVGSHIIEFLAQIEEFQKMLWEKRKFVTETFYCITVGQIDQEFYHEIVENQAQWEEWVKLYRIDDLPDYPRGAKSPSPLRGEGSGEGDGDRGDQAMGTGQIKSRRKEQRSALLKSFAREMRQAPTDAENRLWYFLKDRRLGGAKFRRQHPMGPYIVDFICIDARLIVELDGGQHNTPSGRDQDQERTRWLEGQGFRVVRYWNHEVLENTEGVLESILDELAPHPNPLPDGERARVRGDEEFLKAHPTLVLDTRHLDQDFVDRLLASFDDLDEMTDGLLVHSENWQALNLLGEKYRERLKCIYIDPPFNTAGSEILYKNEYKHSSWLAMITAPVATSHDSLSSDGIMCVAIDDFESPFLNKLLIDIFGGEESHLSTVAVRSNPHGRAMVSGFSRNHEYAIFFARSGDAVVGRLPRDARRQARYPESDEEGIFTWINFRGTGANTRRIDRPKLHYPICISDDGFIRVPSLEWSEANQEWKITDPPKANESIIRPIDSEGLERVWTLGWVRAQQVAERDLIAKVVDGSWQVYRKYRPNQEGRLPDTWWQDAKYSATESGTKVLKELFGKRELFTYPKSIYLVEDCLRASNCKDKSYSLDFFAGSGTTGHAVINLNREDGGGRKFILVEMADYFDSVLLPRIKKVTFSPEWKDGKPKRMATEEEAERSPRIVKVIRLESYEDALNNIEFDDPSTCSGQQAMRFEDYLLQYMLKWETRRSETLLNVVKLDKPFDYRLHLHRDGETRAQSVDLPETFNYLLGMDVQTRKVYYAPHPDPLPGRERVKGEGQKYLVYRGNLRNGRTVAVIWRETEGWSQEDFERDREFVADHDLASGADEIYVNGDSFIPGAQALEGVFKARMFAPVE